MLSAVFKNNRENEIFLFLNAKLNFGSTKDLQINLQNIWIHHGLMRHRTVYSICFDDLNTCLAGDLCFTKPLVILVYFRR